MFIPPEFMDYMVTKSHLSPQEQVDRHTKMHLREIEERGTMLRNLRFDKEDAKKRIKSYVRWGFELYETPEFMNKVDELVDSVYEKKIPAGW